MSGPHRPDLNGSVSDYLTKYHRVASHDPMRGAAMVAGWIRGDWRGLFAELRADCPIFVTPAYTLVTRYPDVHEVLAHEKVFTVRATSPQLDAALGSGFMLSRDATPLNWRERGLMQVMLDRRDVPAVRALAGRYADERLDGASGPLDVVAELFRPIALRVCEEYFGYRGLDPAELARWVRDVIKDCYANPLADQGLHAAAVESGAALMSYLRAELARRRVPGAESSEDVFGRLVTTSLPAACGFDDERIAVNAAGLSLGFVESAPAAMALATRQLLERPEVHAAATQAAREAEAADFDPYVWEALRLDTFFRLMPPRICEQDYLLAAGTARATVVTQGSVVLAALASAMNDDEVVPEPDRFRLDRPPHHHLHFGTGHHHDCLGVHLARVIIPEAVRRLLRRGVEPIAGEDIAFDAIFPDSYRLRLAEAGAPA
jgi:cytochrome P450